MRILTPKLLVIPYMSTTRTLLAAQTVLQGRMSVTNILKGDDDRLLVVVGYVIERTFLLIHSDCWHASPCSVNNADAARDYARRLKTYADQAEEDLLIVMRVYFEKPRTTVGWKGLINDPDLNGSFQINKGLRIARTLLLDIAKLGLPAGCEFLDTITPQYTADLVSWGAIGARTTESQVHRELTSALSMPTGFKNSTDGSVGIAIDACRAARSGHVFLSTGKEGLSSIIETEVSTDKTLNERTLTLLLGKSRCACYPPWRNAWTKLWSRLHSRRW